VYKSLLEATTDTQQSTLSELAQSGGYWENCWETLERSLTADYIVHSAKARSRIFLIHFVIAFEVGYGYSYMLSFADHRETGQDRKRKAHISITFTVNWGRSQKSRLATVRMVRCLEECSGTGLGQGKDGLNWSGQLDGSPRFLRTG